MAGLVKGKEYDWKDSNLALFGSDLERNVKKAAAETEQAWHGSGQKVGQQIWRIEKFKVKPWPKEHYGSFYSGDSYIILNTYKEDDSDELKYDLHFWIGRHSTQDEYGTAAYKTVELDTFLDDKPVQVREVQGYESERFKTYFDALQIWSGGIDSGFRHVKPEEYTPRLLHFAGTKKNVVVNEVDLLKRNVNSDDVFILDLGLKIYQFNGKTANMHEKRNAMQYVQQLKSERGKAHSEVLDEDSTPKTHEFWKTLGDGEPTASHMPDDATRSAFKKVMFRLSDADGSLKMTQVAEGKLAKGDLDPNDVFIVDTGFTIFVWVGSQASKDERAKGIQYGHNYSMKSIHPFLPIVRLSEGQKSAEFDSAFDS